MLYVPAFESLKEFGEPIFVPGSASYTLPPALNSVVHVSPQATFRCAKDFINENWDVGQSCNAYAQDDQGLWTRYIVVFDQQGNVTSSSVSVWAPSLHKTIYFSAR